MVQEKSFIKWRPLVVGIAIILAIYIILASANQGGENALLGFLLGGIVLGFLIEGKIKEILIHGAVLGVVAGLISIVILLIQLVNSEFISMLATSQIAVSVLILLVYDVISALVGSVLGNFVRTEYRRSL